MRSCHSGSVFGAFLTGALIGGVVALLFAPRSGAETRGMIRDFVEDEIDMVKKTGPPPRATTSKARSTATDVRHAEPCVRSKIWSKRPKRRSKMK